MLPRLQVLLLVLSAYWIHPCETSGRCRPRQCIAPYPAAWQPAVCYSGAVSYTSYTPSPTCCQPQPLSCAGPIAPTPYSVSTTCVCLKYSCAQWFSGTAQYCTYYATGCFGENPRSWNDTCGKTAQNCGISGCGTCYTISTYVQKPCLTAEPPTFPDQPLERVPDHAFNRITEQNGASIDRGRPIFLRFRAHSGRIILAKAFTIRVPRQEVDGVTYDEAKFCAGVEVNSLPADLPTLPNLSPHSPVGRHATLVEHGGMKCFVQTGTRLD